MQTVFFPLRRSVQMTAEDFVQPRCQHCGKPVSDDRQIDAKYCSRRCGQLACSHRVRGVPKKTYLRLGC